MRLLLKVSIWYRCQIRKVLSPTMMENNYFFIKKYIKTQSKKKDVLVIFILQETKNSNLFDKYCTRANFKYHTAHEKLVWLNWLNRSITSNTTFRLYFLKETVVAHFQNLFGRSGHDAFWENKDKIHEGGYVKEIFS